MNSLPLFFPAKLTEKIDSFKRIMRQNEGGEARSDDGAPLHPRWGEDRAVQLKSVL